MGALRRPRVTCALALVVAFGATFSCGRPSASRPPTSTTTTTSAALSAPAEPATAIPEITAEPLGTTRLIWAPALLGAKPPVVRIVVRNRGTATLDVTDFHADLQANREELSLRCGEEDPIGRDASRVEPGEAATFDRMFDCVLPLSGTYDASVTVAFGNGAARREELVEKRIPLTVEAPNAEEPRRVNGVPGLWSAVGSGQLLATSTANDHATLAIILVNGGSDEVSLPPMRVSLHVERNGKRATCNEAPVPLHTPRMLEAGDTHLETVNATCVGLGASGRYEISARLLAGEHPTSLGRLRVDVTTDPQRIDPTRGLPRRESE